MKSSSRVNKLKFVPPKFSDCKSCENYTYRNRNPICQSCDCGENFEEIQQDEIDPYNMDFDVRGYYENDE